MSGGSGLMRAAYDTPECNRSRYVQDPEHGRNCPACKADCARYNREWRERNRDRPVPEHLHGRPGTKSNWGCQCEPCDEADKRMRQETRRKLARRQRKVAAARQRAA